MRTRTLLVMLASLGGLLAAAPVKRLDGTTISPGEIDAMVSRLTRAAEVTGTGIAIFNNRKVAYLKTYGVRD